MLRLRPSELTLTPEDVDETFRRMALRQAFRSSRHASPQPPRPVLRRGPQRAVQDAITNLGDIPILRPQAQQAVITSVDEDAEIDQEEHTPRTRERVDNMPGSESPSPDRHANVNTTSPLRALQLPFRIGRGHRGSHIQPSSPDRYVERMPATTTLHETHSQEGFSPATSQSNHSQRTPHTPPATSPSPAELRGGGRLSSGRAVALHQAPSVQSPVHQTQQHDSEGGLLPPPDATSLKDNADEESPMIILRGYFPNPTKHPRGPAYWFHEYRRVQPQTEPRRSSGREAMPARSLSSGSAPAYALHAPSVRPGLSDSEDVSGGPAGPESQPEFEHLIDQRRSSAAPRQFSSEASASSGAYSFYQMPPESRQPSDEYGQDDQHPSFQYDGAAASRTAERGAYLSMRPSDLEAMDNSSRQMSSDMSFSAQHGISPLPSMPYTLPQNTRPAPQELHRGIHADAATAAVGGMVSPLEIFSEHFQRLSGMQNHRQAMPTQSVSSQYHSQANIGPRHTATDASQLRSMDDRLPQQPPAYSSDHPAGQLIGNTDHVPQSTGRDAQATRANQRSSENAPVRPPAQSSGPSRNSQVQIHRAAFERLHNAMQGANIGATDTVHASPSRPSPFQPGTLRHTSNRPRTQDMHSHATSRAQMRRGTPQMSSSLSRPPDQPLSSPTSAAAQGVPPTIPPRNGSNVRGTGARRRFTPVVRSPTQLHAPRASSAITSLRSPMLRAATSARPPRRVPPQQRDQENSGAAEEHLMRQEEAAINARYGNAEQRDVMDETPPRVGRVERRMFS
jgi:hypothetical protein